MADNNATPCERAIPTDAEILTVYKGGGHEAGPGLGPLSTQSSHQGVSHCPK